MITGLLHRIVAHPRVYELVQHMVGAAKVQARLSAAIASLPTPQVVVDLGGGTGRHDELFPPTTRYICLDIDGQKLSGLHSTRANTHALQADATLPPIASNSVDLIFCSSVSHHLTVPQFDALVRHAGRILKPTGHFLFVDANWNPDRLPGRALWSIDRGSHPRTRAALKSTIGSYLNIRQWDAFAIIHEYILCVASPRR